jgi:hypothetical protein
MYIKERKGKALPKAKDLGVLVFVILITNGIKGTSYA